MRILHFLQPPCEQGGDPFAHVYNLAKAQASNSHQVGLVYLDEGTVSLVGAQLAKAQKFCALGVEKITIDTSNPLLKNGTMLNAYRQATAFAQTVQPDLLHGHGESGDVLVRLAQKALKRSKHNILGVYSPHGAPVRSIEGGLALKLMSMLGRNHVDGVIFNSSHCQQLTLQQSGPPSCPSRLIYEGLSKEDFAPRQIIDMAADFMFIGEINQEMGLNSFVQVLARLKTSHPTGALIIGSGSHEKRLRAQVDRYGLSPTVFFNAPINARSAFLKGGCLVLPAKSSNIPTIALQAAGAGVPMILTNVGAIPELIGNVNMPLIAPNDTEALQEQMIAYLTNPQLFLSRAAMLKQRMTTHFTLARMFKETDEFYQSLAQTSR